MRNVYITSAFSSQNSGGNLAGVVLQADGISGTEKQKLAAELGFSETAFISDSECADFLLEYFTPKGEVPLCGHATIASFVTMASLGITGRKEQYTIETKAGILQMELTEDGMVFMEQNCPVFGQILAPDALAACFPAAVIDGRYPVQIVSTGLKDILVPVDSAAHLKEAAPDFQAMAEISRQQDVIGVHAFSLVNDKELTAVCRNFAPLYGIPEESATGTSNCALACYLFHHGMKREQYLFEQGHNLGSISRIKVRLESRNDRITKVSVGGYGYVIEERTM